MSYVKVGILMGGKSSEHEVSLETGKNVIRALTNPYTPVPVRLTRDNEWTMEGKVVPPHEAFGAMDIAFIAMHGEYGEDGRLQALLASHRVPYTGSGPLASHLAMHKNLSKRVFERAGIPTPRWVELRAYEKEPVHHAVERVTAALHGPWVVKPASKGSSIGVRVVRDQRELGGAIAQTFSLDPVVLVEQYHAGREITCGVLERFPMAGVNALPPTEIRVVGEPFFTYGAKYNPTTEEITPAPLPKGALHLVQHLAKRAHTALGCEGYSRSDFIVADSGVYLLEVNTLPGLTETSLFPKAAAAAGMDFEHLVHHLLTRTGNRLR